MTTPPLAFIDGDWRQGAGPIVATRGPLGEDKPRYHAADRADVDAAMATLARGFLRWSATPRGEREQILQRYAVLAAGAVDRVAAVLADEVGKPMWECLEEANALAGKVDLTIAAMHERAVDTQRELAGFRGAVRHRPHGVFAVFVPYNLPAHLPNGHLLPALLAGNTVAIKASELAPRTSMLMVELLLAAGLPSDAIALLPGGRATGEALIENKALRGVAFTGSSATGRAIHKALGGRTEVIAALEMGGNNPMVVLQDSDPAVVGPLAVLSSMMTTGQRCTSARRLIVLHGERGDAVVAAATAAAADLRIDHARAEPEPFCGPLVAPEVADAVFAAWERRVALGGRVLLPMRRLALSPAALSAGVIDVTDVVDLPDEEVFGPLLHIIRVADEKEAFARAAATRYGLSAALIGGDTAAFTRFRDAVPAGICNHNRPTNGALSTQPFGGTGHSGDHRPAGWASVDYCVWPMASTESPEASLPAHLPPGLVRGAP